MKKNIFLLIIIACILFTTCKEEDKETFNSAKACFDYYFEEDEAENTFVEFSNCSQNATSYLWNFGDSTFSIDENPSHYYSENGSFLVSLTAYSESDSNMVSDTIFVDWVNDIEACFSFNFEEDETGNTFVKFSNCSQNATSYLWDFGDSFFSNEENPSHYYSENGNFIVSLTAYAESDSNKVSDTIFVNWINDVEACFRYEKWEVYILFINCSENATSYLWDFGDGSFSTDKYPIHFFSKNGTFEVSLTAYSESDSSKISEIIIVDWVTNETDDIKACFDYFDNEERYVQFYNCSQNATSYYWDFGDNSFSKDEFPSHQYPEDGMYVVSLTAYNELESDIISDTIYVEWIQVDKPNIYLYPKENINLSVRLDFPQGGQVVKSIPTYNDEWCVNVNTSGLIDNKYEYLFYESVQPDVWQYQKGWCIKKEFLKDFFEANMKEYNFSEKEIKDFTEYWIPILTDFEYYNIYPQCNEQIEKVIQLNFSTQPNNIFRLFYGIIGTSTYQELPDPKISRIKRDDFFVVEWGVFRK